MCAYVFSKSKLLRSKHGPLMDECQLKTLRDVRICGKLVSFVVLPKVQGSQGLISRII